MSRGFSVFWQIILLTEATDFLPNDFRGERAEVFCQIVFEIELAEGFIKNFALRLMIPGSAATAVFYQ